MWYQWLYFRFFTHKFWQVYLIHLVLDLLFIIKQYMCNSFKTGIPWAFEFFFLNSGRVYGTYKAISCCNVNSYLVLIPDKELHYP